MLTLVSLALALSAPCLFSACAAAGRAVRSPANTVNAVNTVNAAHGRACRAGMQAGRSHPDPDGPASRLARRRALDGPGAWWWGVGLGPLPASLHQPYAIGRCDGG